MCFHCLSSSQQSITHPKYSNHGESCDITDASMDNNAQHLGDDDDDDDDDSDHSFVPDMSELESFSEESSEEEEEEDEEDDTIGGQKIEPNITTPMIKKTSKETPQGTPRKTNSASSRRTRSRERVSSSALTNDCSVSFNGF